MKKRLKIGPVSIRPDVGMLSMLRHLNYKPWFALAEYVDNALQSYLTHRKEIQRVGGRNTNVKIDIDIQIEGGGRIVVRDNAAGIYEREFPHAFRPAEPPEDTSGLSEFGVGMKSASCWFAKNWSVRTKALGEAVERTVTFDIKQILHKKLEELEVAERSAKPQAHYTEITLWGLHHSPKGRTVGKIKDHLTSIYRMFLRDGTLTLLVDGEELKYEEPTVLKAAHYRAPKAKAKVWRKEIDFELGKRKRIHGFAALRETASTAYAGLALFRRKRLIQGSADETYRPAAIFKKSNSYTYQRLFGELTLEGFDVSHTKDGFRFEDVEELLLEKLQKELERGSIDLLDQAEGYRAKPPRKSLQSTAQSATAQVAGVVESSVPPLLQKEAESPARPDALPGTVRRSPRQASEKTVAVHDGTRRWEVTIRTSTDSAIGAWLRLGKRTQKKDKRGEIRCLTIDVALDHPFVDQFVGTSNENVELLLRFAIAISVSLVLAQDGDGGDPSFALHHLNELLRDVLSKP